MQGQETNKQYTKEIESYDRVYSYSQAIEFIKNSIFGLSETELQELIKKILIYNGLFGHKVLVTNHLLDEYFDNSPKWEYLTKEQIIEKYGDRLTEEELQKLKK